MKKVKNGKMYNTETATKICGWYNGLNCNDFNYMRVTLYRKKNTELFATILTYSDNFIVNKSEYLVNYCPRFNNFIDFAETILSGEEFESFFGEIKE